MMHYFAADGSYGEAVGMVVIDTSKWDVADWIDIEGALDEERAKEAVEIAGLHESAMAHMDDLASEHNARQTVIDTIKNTEPTI